MLEMTGGRPSVEAGGTVQVPGLGAGQLLSANTDTVALVIFLPSGRLNASARKEGQTPAPSPKTTAVTQEIRGEAAAHTARLAHAADQWRISSRRAGRPRR